ncbi:class I SAM-dependent methyltransferase [Lucifera butyrica]|uniref:class I SAM-dependent methyltransferase n=1 Tax=Lucifera butyrica TaxID=1351585 RepID=UPI0014026DCA|nr:methyltransferase domain-containing protein [Lucifera butyrica]
MTKKMLATLPWDKIETIAELGAGTGVFTNFIAQNKREACRVLIIEQDLEMREALQTKFSSFYYGTNAEKLDVLLQRYDLPQVNCIVSGLPFATFSVTLRNEIMEAINRSLKPGGIFVAFQYSLQMRKVLKQHFSEIEIEFVPLNLPPAFVYRCQK